MIDKLKLIAKYGSTLVIMLLGGIISLIVLSVMIGALCGAVAVVAVKTMQLIGGL